MTNHNFVPNDTVIFVAPRYSGYYTLGKKYLVLEVGFWNIKIINDMGTAEWVSGGAFQPAPRVTIVKKHLRRIVFGR